MKGAILFLATVSPALALDIPALLAGLGPAPDSDPRFQNHVPPGPGDVRAPCPGLNTLANHNFIHHNGKNMTIPHLLQGLAEGMNIGADFTVAIGGAGLLASPFPLGGSFDLDQLDQHNFPIEHDASLSRKDAYFGDDHSFNLPYWQSFLSNFHGAKQTSLQSASLAKYSRVLNSNSTDPDFTYGIREFVLSYGETALYLQTMSDPSSNGVANINYIRSLFENETLPYNLGWRVSQQAITLETLGSQVLQLYSVSPQPVPEGEKITADSYKDIFEVIVGGSEVLNNLTSGISSVLGL